MVFGGDGLKNRLINCLTLTLSSLVSALVPALASETKFTLAVVFGDLVFSEIMADPEPAVGLPEVEYVELHNRTAQTINLSGWTFWYDGKSYAFPVSSIESNSYLVLCSKGNSLLFDANIPVSPFTSFPTLANGGKTLYLLSDDGNLVACVEYDDDWYGSGFKSKGGWSLECLDTDNLSGETANWTASVDSSGGSPGRVNSVKAVNPDNELPVCIHVYVPASGTLELHFSKSMDVSWLGNMSDFYFPQGSNIVTGILPGFPMYRKLTLNLSDTLVEGVIHELVLRGMTDISGNSAADTSIFVALPEKPDSFDLSLNELLFNPEASGSDYMEVVNRSDRCLDLSDIWLTSRNEAGLLNEGSRLTEQPVPALPGSYWVLSACADSLGVQCGSDSLSHFLTVANIPSMPDDAGNLVLITTDGQVLDEVTYSDDWHFVLMSDKEGVALEKIHPDKPSGRQDSWVSASSLAGYGTPGRKNSQYKEETTTDGTFLSISQAWLTPDNDGLDDLICIRLTLPEPATVSLILYDLTGRVVKYLLRNKWLGTDDEVCWDSTDEKGSLVSYGRYVLMGMYVTPSGKVVKKKVVLTVLL